MEEAPRPVLALVGPTASGKSDLAVRLALDLPFPVEVVSCDAFQIYRGLEIGAGAPSGEARRAVPHHLLGVLEPDDPATAGRYAGLAARAVRATWARGGVPLVVGGSGLYFRALREGLFSGPAPDPALRLRLDRLFDRPRGAVWLRRLLARLDPAAHRAIHGNDRVRLARALEVAVLAGAPISALRAARAVPLPEARWLVVGLDPGPEALDRRIARRVRGMFASGLAGEAAAMEERFGEKWPGRSAIGYREALAALAGDPAPEDLPARIEEAESRTVTATRRYAKRQRTWFRAEPGVRWRRGDPGAPETLAEIRAEFVRFVEGEGGSGASVPAPRIPG